MAKKKNSRKTTRRRRSGVRGYSTKGIMDAITQEAIPAAVGFMLGNLLDKQLTAVANNPTISNLIKIGAGVAARSMGSGMVASIGSGLAANGIYDLAAPQLEKAGILGIGALQLPYSGHRIAGTPEMVAQ